MIRCPDNQINASFIDISSPSSSGRSQWIDPWPHVGTLGSRSQSPSISGRSTKLDQLHSAALSTSSQGRRIIVTKKKHLAWLSVIFGPKYGCISDFKDRYGCAIMIKASVLVTIWLKTFCSLHFVLVATRCFSSSPVGRQHLGINWCLYQLVATSSGGDFLLWLG